MQPQPLPDLSTRGPINVKSSCVGNYVRFHIKYANFFCYPLVLPSDPPPAVGSKFVNYGDCCCFGVLSMADVRFL